MNNEPDIERRLGFTEAAFWMFSKIIPVYFTIYARIKGDLPKKSLSDALLRVQERHPLLRVRIVRENRSSGRFESGGIPAIPLKTIQIPESGLSEVVEKELATVMPDDKGPLMRCLLARHKKDLSTIILTFHHTIGDATSGAFLIRDLIHAIDLTQQAKDASLPSLPSKQSLDAYVPEYARSIHGRISGMKAFLRMLSNILRHGFPIGPKRDSRVPIWQCRPQVVTRSFEPDFVQKIRERAGREKTTVHGALTAAKMIAIVKDYPEIKPRHLMALAPINLRSQLVPPIAEDVGLFVTMGFSMHMASEGSNFWELARQIRASLSRCVERGEPYGAGMRGGDIGLLLKIIGAGRAGAMVTQILTSMKTANTFTLSNLGNVSIPVVHGKFKIETIGFAAPTPSSFGSFAVTLDDLMTWNFVGMEPICSKEHLVRLADRTEQILRRNMD